MECRRKSLLRIAAERTGQARGRERSQEPPARARSTCSAQRKETPTGSQTKLMVETRDAMVGMAVAYNDRPLNPDQRQGEYGRIQRFINDPAELDRKRKKEKEDSERVKSILKALPDAFLYEYDGTEAGRAGVGKTGKSTGAAQVPS